MKRADQLRTRSAVGRVTNAAHVSTTDAEARLYRKGSGEEAKLSFMGHAMTETVMAGNPHHTGAGISPLTHVCADAQVRT